ncbi:MAG: T9SS type A sorting domain-containing protein, partial [Bacteroidales bacterium]|nr:T9SS type A sorting domain-containing protein [Bacteroidales bacterium]
KIFDPSGKIRDKGQFEGNTYQLDLSSFAAGLYYMTLIDDKGNAIKSEKIIIHE